MKLNRISTIYCVLINELAYKWLGLIIEYSAGNKTLNISILSEKVQKIVRLLTSVDKLYSKFTIIMS